MRVYISGPITGTDDYMQRFRIASERVKALGHEVINPAMTNATLPSSTTYEEYMGMSLKLMGMADAAYFLKGWQDSKGCNREYGYACATEMLLLFEEDE